MMDENNPGMFFLELWQSDIFLGTCCWVSPGKYGPRVLRTSLGWLDPATADVHLLFCTCSSWTHHLTPSCWILSAACHLIEWSEL